MPIKIFIATVPLIMILWGEKDLLIERNNETMPSIFLFSKKLSNKIEKSNFIKAPKATKALLIITLDTKNSNFSFYFELI